MADKTVLKDRVLGEVIEFARNNYADEIDEAYDYFWEEEYPEDYMSGIALDIGFINFEDWLVCDRKVKDGRTLIDLFIKERPDLKKEELEALSGMKESVISLYEVAGVSPKPLLRDLLLGEEFPVKKGLPAGGLKKGDVFGARFFLSGGERAMGKCIYPYGAAMKGKALAYINKQFERYLRNENPSGQMRDFLKAYPDIFNIIWFSSLQGSR